VTRTFSGLGPTRRGCEISWAEQLGSSGWLRTAHAAPIPPAPLAVGACRVLLEDIISMFFAERLVTLDLARSPGNPQDCRPPIPSLVLRGHADTSPFCSDRGGETPT